MMKKIKRLTGKQRKWRPIIEVGVAIFVFIFGDQDQQHQIAGYRNYVAEKNRQYRQAFAKSVFRSIGF